MSKWSGLVVLLANIIPTAALPVHSAQIGSSEHEIGTWPELEAAVKAAGPAATLTLSPSFSMDGYDGSPIFDSKAVTIEGQGATFDAAGNGSFFFVLEGVSLTVRNVTLKNADGGGAVFVNRGGRLTLDGCTLVNNTCADDGGGALYFMPGATGLIKGCSFVGPFSQYHNNIFRNAGKITFACADGEVGRSVQLPQWPHEVTVIPPKGLTCK